jgi:hypothetical protein
MSSGVNPTRPRRVRYQPVGLGLVLAVCIALVLVEVTGGLLFYVFAAAAALALLGLLHYAIWGHNAPHAGTSLPGAGTAPPDVWQHQRDRRARR